MAKGGKNHKMQLQFFGALYEIVGSFSTDIKVCLFEEEIDKLKDYVRPCEDGRNRVELWIRRRSGGKRHGSSHTMAVKLQPGDVGYVGEEEREKRMEEKGGDFLGNAKETESAF